MRRVFSKLGAMTLSDRIGQSIEQAIMKGALTPGERLNTDALARQFKVSHIPVREALKKLEAIGVIVQEPNKGAFVLRLTSDDIVQIFEVRKALEGLAASMAATRIDQITKRRLQSLVDEMRDAAESENFVELSIADKKFHQTLWDVSRNPFLIKCLSTLLLPYFGFIASQGYLRHEKDLEYVPRVHQKILNAVASGDSERAQQTIIDIHSRSMRLLTESRPAPKG